MPWVVERYSSGCRARSSGRVRRRDSRVRAHRPLPLGPLQPEGGGERHGAAGGEFARGPPVGDEFVTAAVADHAAGGEHVVGWAGGEEAGSVGVVHRPVARHVEQRRRRGPSDCGDEQVTLDRGAVAQRHRFTRLFEPEADVMPSPDRASTTRAIEMPADCRAATAESPDSFAVNTTARVPGFTPYIRISRWTAPDVITPGRSLPWNTYGRSIVPAATTRVWLSP